MRVTDQGVTETADPLQPLDLADHASMLKTYRVSLAQLSRNDQVRLGSMLIFARGTTGPAG